MPSTSSYGRFAPKPTHRTIKEVYDNSNPHERFAAELEEGLVAKVDYIIIDPQSFADNTSRWIMIGNGLHNTALIAGISSLAASLVWRERPAIAVPICALSTLCTGLYCACWSCDPCCQYQVVKNIQDLRQTLPLLDVSSPTILRRTPNTAKTIMHRSITLLSIAVCAWQIWRAVN